MIFETGNPARKMFWGDIWLTGCCIFYLLWWILAFRPAGAVKGIKSGWLLIPALILGVAAAVMIIRGAAGADTDGSFFSSEIILAAGAVSYMILLIATQFIFHRQVTSELFLIVAWTGLAFLEINALYALGFLAWNKAVVLFAAAVIAAALSMICYMLYYDLSGWAGYVDGMIPLLLVAVFMAALAVLIVRRVPPEG